MGRINDPLVGTFMDFMFAKSKKAEKFRPWILRSIPILVIGMSCLFALPTLFDGMLCMVVLFITKIVYELGYTIMNIGMGSLLGVMATMTQSALLWHPLVASVPPSVASSV